LVDESSDIFDLETQVNRKNAMMKLIEI